MTDHADIGRGARVEVAVRAAQNGDLATAAGILAGMSRQERDEFGPLIAAVLPSVAHGGIGAGTGRHRG